MRKVTSFFKPAPSQQSPASRAAEKRPLESPSAEDQDERRSRPKQTDGEVKVESGALGAATTIEDIKAKLNRTRQAEKKHKKQVVDLVTSGGTPTRSCD
jgi:hypothetical protein